MASIDIVEGAGNLELGEGPHWHIPTKSLYYVDIFGKSIYRYTPEDNTKSSVNLNKYVSLIVPVEGKKDQYVIGMERSICHIKWDGKSDKMTVLKVLAEVDTEDEKAGNRINDGKCDAAGRLWFGTMGVEPVNGQIKPNMGCLYSLEGTNLRRHLSNVHISNGLAWNHDSSKFYYIDSGKKFVEEYNYDIKTGIISGGKDIFSLSTHSIEGLCDGMTIDANGNLWVAIFNGCQVIKINPNKPQTLMQHIKLPAKQVTSVAFGGPDLQDLFITSARFTIENEVLNPPAHGAIYKVSGLGIKGVPAYNFKI